MADRMNIKFTLQAVDRFSRNMDKLDRKLTTLQATADKFDINRDVQITADTAQALNEIKTLQRSVEKLDRDATKKRKIAFKTEHATRELNRMGDIINGMNPSEIDIDTDTRSTFRELRRVDDFLTDMRRNNTKIKTRIDMDSGGAERSLSRISDMVTGIGDRRLQIDGDNRGAMNSLREVDTFMTDLQRNNRKIRTDFEIEIGGATASLQRIARQTRELHNHASRNLPMQIDTFQATRALRGLQRVVNKAARPREIRIDTDLDGAISRLGAVRTLAATIAEINPEIDVGADTTEATAKLSMIQRLKNRIGRPVFVDVLVRDYGKFRNRMDRIATTGRNVGEILTNMFMGVATMLSTTLVPIIASTTGAIGSLGVMIGVTAGASMGLLSAFVGAGAAAVGFGAVAIPVIKHLNEHVEDVKSSQEKYQKALRQGNEEQAAKYLAEYEYALSQMSSEQIKAMENMDKFKAKFKELSDAMEPGVLAVYAGALQAVTTMLEMGRPMIEASVDAVRRLTEALNANLEADDMKAFFKFLNEDAAFALETVVKALGNFIMGFFNMMAAFGPLSKEMSGGLLDLSERFREWSAALGDNAKFQAFVDYVSKNWPLVRGIIGSAIAAIIETFAGFSGYAESWMATTQDLINKWREFAQGMGENEKFQKFVDYMKTNGPLVTAMIGDMVGFLVALGVALAPVGSKMVEVASAVFDFMTNTLQANPVLGELFGWIITLAGGFFALLPLGVALVSFFSSLITIGGAVVGFVTRLAAKFGGFTGILTKVKSAFETFRIVLMMVTGAVTPLIAAIVIAIGLVIAVIVRMWKENERFREIVIAVWEAVKKAFFAAVEWISTTVMAIVGALVEWWQENQDSFFAIAKLIWDKIYYAIETAIMWILETVMTVAGKISEFWSEHGDTILAIAEFAWEAIKTTIEQFVSFITTVIEIGLGIIKGIFEYIWPQISGAVKIAWEVITGIVETSIDVVMGIIDTIMNLIKGDWEAAWDSILGIVEDIWDGIVETFEDIDLYQIGADIIQGLVDGVLSMTGAVWDAAKEVGAGLIDTAKDILQMKSPSRAFRTIGEYTMMGMQVGIENEASRTIKAVTSVAERMTSAFNPELEASMKVASGYGSRNSYAGANASYASARSASAREREAAMQSRVEVPVYLNGREIARASNDEQKKMNNREEARQRKFGRGGAQ